MKVRPTQKPGNNNRGVGPDETKSVKKFLCSLISIYTILGLFGLYLGIRSTLSGVSLELFITRIVLITIYFVLICLGVAGWRDCTIEIQRPVSNPEVVKEHLRSIAKVNWIFFSILWAVGLSSLLFMDFDTLSESGSLRLIAYCVVLSIPFTLLNTYYCRIRDTITKMMKKNQRSMTKDSNFQKSLAICFEDLMQKNDEYEDGSDEDRYQFAN